MSKRQPNDADRWIAHTLVGIGAGALVGQKAGIPGFVVGAVVAILVHEALDAPLAAAIAEVT